MKGQINKVSLLASTGRSQKSQGQKKLRKAVLGEERGGGVGGGGGAKRGKKPGAEPPPVSRVDVEEVGGGGEGAKRIVSVVLSSPREIILLTAFMTHSSHKRLSRWRRESQASRQKQVHASFVMRCRFISVSLCA